MDIEVFTIGYRKDSLACYGAVLAADDITFESTKILGDVTKNQADVIAVIMALRCIKADRRDQKVILNSPPGYAAKITERRADGGWLAHPKANLEIVQEARKIIETFPNIEIKNSGKKPPAFCRCIELVQECHKNAS